jgi:hypothetical protein
VRDGSEKFKEVINMKDVEKAAIVVGTAALGLAAYQALKTKQQADAVMATDPGKHPVSAAADQAKAVIGNTKDWFFQLYDGATGRIKGRSEKVLDKISAKTSGVSYAIKKVKDFGTDAAEAGTKYVWSLGAKTATTGKRKLDWLTNKPFTLMGAAPTYIYGGVRKLPKKASVVGNVLTGIGSRLEKTTDSAKGIGGRLKGGIMRILPWRG